MDGLKMERWLVLPAAPSRLSAAWRLLKQIRSFKWRGKAERGQVFVSENRLAWTDRGGAADINH